MRPRELDTIVEGYRYRTTESVLLAGDDYKDGNYEREGTNTFLYRTKNNRYFYVRQHSGPKPDRLEPISWKRAMRMFHDLTEHRVEFSEAFPGIDIIDA